MIDRIFSAALTFALLIGGTLAIGSVMFDRPPATTAHASVRVVELPHVVVIAKRDTPAPLIARNDIDLFTAAR